MILNFESAPLRGKYQSICNPVLKGTKKSYLITKTNYINLKKRKNNSFCYQNDNSLNFSNNEINLTQSTKNDFNTNFERKKSLGKNNQENLYEKNLDLEARINSLVYENAKLSQYIIKKNDFHERLLLKLEENTKFLTLKVDELTENLNEKEKEISRIKKKYSIKKSKKDEKINCKDCEFNKNKCILMNLELKEIKENFQDFLSIKDDFQLNSKRENYNEKYFKKNEQFHVKLYI